SRCGWPTPVPTGSSPANGSWTRWAAVARRRWREPMSTRRSSRQSDAPAELARNTDAGRLEAGGAAFVNAARILPEEMPIALSFNGVTHAVMLATPGDLEDFGAGFALSEGIVDDLAEILDLNVAPQAGGIEVAMRLTARRAA